MNRCDNACSIHKEDYSDNSAFLRCNVHKMDMITPKEWYSGRTKNGHHDSVSPIHPLQVNKHQVEPQNDVAKVQAGSRVFARIVCSYC